MSSVLLSVNGVVTESVTLSSAALDKEFFDECPTKKHSAKRRTLGKERDSVSVWITV
jgi:hypothetical protein